MAVDHFVPESSRAAKAAWPSTKRKQERGKGMNAIVRWLKPREMIFFDLLESAAENILEATTQFSDGIRCEDPSRFARLRIQIKEFEHKGDEITRQLLETVDRTFVTPIEREDILDLAHAMDDVVDCLDSAAARLEIYRVDTALPRAKEMSGMLVEGAKGLVPLIQGLRYMSDVKDMRRRIVDITTLEGRSDAVFHAALAELFESSKDPIYLIKWKEIFEQLEEGMDRIELVAKVVGSTVMRNA